MKRTSIALALLAVAAGAGPAEAQRLPGGSYAGSCEVVGFDGTNITASCRKRSGNTATTVLDIRQCAQPELANDNGRLTCSGKFGGTITGRLVDDAPPAAPVDRRPRPGFGDEGPGYGQGRPRYDEGQGQGYGQGRPRYDDQGQGYGQGRPRYDDQGQGYSQPRPRGSADLPGGSYQRSCRVEGFDGYVLRASCRTYAGDYVRTRIDVRECGRNGALANDDGRLVCLR